MLWIVGSIRFYRRLSERLGGVEEQRAERVLATARIFLCAAALLAIYSDPTEPREYSEQIYLLLVAYLLYSLVALLWLRIRQKSSPSFRMSIHGIDIVWATCMTLFTSGPTSPFFFFFVFVLLAGAYRWGMIGALLTATLAVLFLFTQASIAFFPGDLGRFLGVPFSLNRYIVMSTYLVIMSILFGYIAQSEMLLRAEISSVARIMGRAQRETVLNRTIQVITDELLHIYDARLALLALREESTSRVFLWEATRSESETAVRLHASEAEASIREIYFADPSVRSLRAVFRGEACSTLALNDLGRRIRNGAKDLSSSLRRIHPCRSILCVSAVTGEEWSNRLFVLDSRPEVSTEEGLRFLQKLVLQVSPAVQNVYLLRRIRSRVGALEQAKIARELHDGPIQSLIAVEMHVDVLRRQADRKSPGLADDLKEVQNQLRQEVLGLRELMQEIKPLNIGPRQVLEFLADTVERFGRETGTATSFVCGLDQISLLPRTCREIARIVQEALVNVRKHSSAGRVEVRLGPDDGDWKLEIEDNGRGYDFTGRLTLTELDAVQKGPGVIKERVRSIKGDLVIESDPGQGSRLVITFPRESYG